MDCLNEMVAHQLYRRMIERLPIGNPKVDETVKSSKKDDFV